MHAAVCATTDQRQQTSRRSSNNSNGMGPGDGREAGDNPVGLTIRTLYGVGGPSTIRWGLLKRPVEPVSQVSKSGGASYLPCGDLQQCCGSEELSAEGADQCIRITAICWSLLSSASRGCGVSPGPDQLVGE